MKEISQYAGIQKHIYLIRGLRVMLSTDIARLYEVKPKTLVQAVKRNLNRFPSDFMFQLSFHEVNLLRSQIVTANWSKIRTPPYAFTEQGIAMLSTVLGSETAINTNIEIMRTFVTLRKNIASHEDLAERLDQLEQKYNGQFDVIFEAIRELMAPPETSKTKISIISE